MSNNNNHPLGEAPWFHVILSTGLGTGFIPGAPGTAGAFFALAIWYVVYLFTGATATLFWITLALVVVTTVVGAWTSKVMERYWGEDPRSVVIDEFVGTWIPLLVAATPERWETALLGRDARRCCGRPIRPADSARRKADFHRVTTHADFTANFITSEMLS